MDEEAGLLPARAWARFRGEVPRSLRLGGEREEVEEEEEEELDRWEKKKEGMIFALGKEIAR